MRDRRKAAAPRHGARAGQEGSLITRFVGSYPAADFRLIPPLPEIAVIGRSNVGKSTMINALVGRRSLARTSQTPGKTRLCNVFAVAERFYLVDLPGYGWARASRQQRAGLQRLVRDCLVDRATLSGVLWLLDIRHAPSRDDHAMAALLGDRGLPVLAAVTKADKIPQGRRAAHVGAILDALELGEDQCVITSARTREGIGDLTVAVDGLVGRGGRPGMRGTA
jgi:GTP-binding protein